MVLGIRDHHIDGHFFARARDGLVRLDLDLQALRIERDREPPVAPTAQAARAALCRVLESLLR